MLLRQVYSRYGIPRTRGGRLLPGRCGATRPANRQSLLVGNARSSSHRLRAWLAPFVPIPDVAPNGETLRRAAWLLGGASERNGSSARSSRASSVGCRPKLWITPTRHTSGANDSELCACAMPSSGTPPAREPSGCTTCARACGGASSWPIVCARRADDSKPCRPRPAEGRRSRARRARLALRARAPARTRPVGGRWARGDFRRHGGHTGVDHADPSRDGKRRPVTVGETRQGPRQDPHRAVPPPPMSETRTKTSESVDEHPTHGRSGL